MKILVTGFDPFGGEKMNPAYEAVKLLPDRIAGMEIIKLEVPTVFHQSIDVVMQKVREVQPDAIVLVGKAGGRTDISFERVAINVDDARIPDNKGQQPLDVPIIASGENAYFSTLPARTMINAIQKEGLAASLSNTAGTFVCNHLMYGVLHHTQEMEIPVGFVHVPYVPEQIEGKAGVPAMELGDIVRGLEVAIGVVMEEDKRMVVGREF